MAESVRVVWHGKEVLFATRERAVEGLKAAGDYLLETANETVPRESGFLADSGRSDVDQEALEVRVSYSAVYAMAQHEDTEFRHPEGRAKWLQLTLQEQRDRVYEMLAEAARV